MSRPSNPPPGTNQVLVQVDETGLGKHMLALTPRQRAFVYALVETGGNATQAALAAGYGAESETHDKKVATCRTRGYQLAHDEKILTAIKEEASKRLNSGALLAASALLEIVLDPKHKSRLKAIEVLLDRSGLVVKNESTLNINVNGGSDSDAVARIKDLSGKLGIDPRVLLGNAGVVVDAEFSVVEAPIREAPEEEIDWDAPIPPETT